MIKLKRSKNGTRWVEKWNKYKSKYGTDSVGRKWDELGRKTERDLQVKYGTSWVEIRNGLKKEFSVPEFDL